jgi:hypothetical protein
LFHFDVHDDVRMTIDVTVEKDESHPGKVVLLSWCKYLIHSILETKNSLDLSHPLYLFYIHR